MNLCYTSQKCCKCKTEKPKNEDSKNFNDPIKSGESRFKIISFEPTLNDSHDVQKCKEFWKFIDGRRDVLPMKSFRMKCDGQKKGSTVSVPDESASCSFSWGDALNLLKQHKLDKLAVASIPTTRTCKYCTVPCKTHKSQDEFTEDSFDIKQLNKYNPQEIFYADKAVITDPIMTISVGTQTDFELPEQKERRLLKEACEDFDAYLEELRGIFDEKKFLPQKCTCKDSCVCLFNNKVVTIASSSDFLPISPTKINKSTCKCGEVLCKCTKLDLILKEVGKANDSIERLSFYELKACKCANQIPCDCLDDLKAILKTKLEIKGILKKQFKQDVELKIPVECKCECKTHNCPCSIVIRLINEVNQIMEEKERTKEHVSPHNIICDVIQTTVEAACPCTCCYNLYVDLMKKISPEENVTKSFLNEVCKDIKIQQDPDCFCDLHTENIKDMLFVLKPYKQSIIDQVEILSSGTISDDLISVSTGYSNEPALETKLTTNKLEKIDPKKN